LFEFSKIINPNLEIYRFNGSKTMYYPDSRIQLYPCDNIKDYEMRQILLALRR